MKSTLMILYRTLAVIGIILATLTAHADILFSNFGPGDTFSIGTAWEIGARQQVAGSFTTPDRMSRFESADIALLHIDGVNAVKFSLVEDNQGLPTGKTLLTTILTDVDPLSGNVVTWSPIASLLMGANTTYWLVGQPGNANSRFAWNENAINQLGWSSNLGSGWRHIDDLAPTFRIHGAQATVAPEPGPAELIFVPLILLSALLRRRNKSHLSLS